jgi:FixJ family two-component response regulator
MPPRKLIIVDDDTIMRSLLRRYLLRDFPSFQVWDYHSAEQAMSQAESGGVDLLITDYRMPGMDGMALAKRLRDQGLTLPIILISEHDDVLLPQEDSGIDLFLEKRFLAGGLAPALRSLLEAA